MNKHQVLSLAVGVVAAFGLAGCAGSAPVDCTAAGVSCTPEGQALAGVPAVEAPAAVVPTTDAPVAEASPAGSACDVAREALLTGSEADVSAAMDALIADTGAPTVAREYASNYNNRDKNDADMQKLDVALIQSSCSTP